MFFQINFQCLAYHSFGCCSHFRVSQFSFGLSFKLGVRELYGNNCRKTLAHIFTGEFLVFFYVIIFCGVVVYYARQGCSEACNVHAAFGSVNIVGIGKYPLLKIVRILYGHFNGNLFHLFGNIKWR